MSTRMRLALWLVCATRYGSLPPGRLTLSPATTPCAIDGDLHVSTATTINDSVNFIQQVNTVPQRASLLTSQVHTAPQRAPLRLVAFNTSYETMLSPWAAVGTSTSPLAVESSVYPLVRSECRDTGRPPDIGSIPRLNTSMVERFLLEFLIYLCFEGLRRPLSIHSTLELVCRLWLGISATLLWFFTYCASIARFAIACSLLLALHVTCVALGVIPLALGVIYYSIWLACSLFWFACRFACSLLCGTVNFTRALGDSLAGLAL